MRWESVIDEMRRQVETGLRPSIQTCVWWRGECVVDAAVGEGASTDAPYLLWSTTKPFVSLALLSLIEAGRADLDDPIGKHIPEFATRGKEAATIAHVLTHRGGFPDNRPELRRELSRLARDWDAALAFVCDMEAAWTPGRDRGYHPLSGWFVVGELVRRLDGRPLADAVRARVLDPAGIADDGFSLGRPDALGGAPMPVRTRDERGAPPEGECRYWNDPATHRAVIPGGGGIARANQVVKLYLALLAGLSEGGGEGGPVLSPEGVRLATSVHVVGIPDRTFLRDIPWGLGFHLKHVRPSLDDCGASATPGTFGHGGHFLVNTAWADPGKQLAACILSNGLTEPRAGIRGVQALSQAIHDVVDGAAA